VSTSRFSRYLLRTTDLEGAASFYDAVLGRRGDGIALLPEAAIARGARPHWLGHIGVHGRGAAEVMAARFVELGAQRLGSLTAANDFVILRDPGGAIVAVTDSSAESSADVAWHQLNTRDPSVAAANYSSVFGWSLTETIDLGTLGRQRHFAFGAGESSAGAIADIEGRPEVHAHWLFFFTVASLDTSVDQVRAKRGMAIGPFELPNGARVAVCDDAQGAAFGLFERKDHG